MERIKKMRINPVLDKELIIGSRSVKLAIFLALYNVIMMLIALPVFQGIVGAQSGRIEYVNVMQIYPVLAFTQCVIICFIIPIITASSISGERERQTLDVMLTTPISPMQIVRGKILSAMFNVLLYVLCSLPIMSIAFIFGGMSWLSIIKFILLVMVASAFAGSIGVFCSSVTKKTITSIVLSLILLGVFIFGSIALLAGGIAVVELVFQGGGGNFNYKFMILPLAPLANPAVLIGNQVLVDFMGVGVNEVGRECKDNLMPYLYFITQHWTIFSVLTTLLFTRFFMGLAARAINPVKGKTRAPKYINATQNVQAPQNGQAPQNMQGPQDVHKQ